MVSTKRARSCSICGQPGHNKQTCRAKSAASEATKNVNAPLPSRWVTCSVPWEPHGKLAATIDVEGMLRFRRTDRPLPEAVWWARPVSAPEPVPTADGLWETTPDGLPWKWIADGEEWMMARSKGGVVFAQAVRSWARRSETPVRPRWLK